MFEKMNLIYLKLISEKLKRTHKQITKPFNRNMQPHKAFRSKNFFYVKHKLILSQRLLGIPEMKRPCGRKPGRGRFCASRE